MTGLTRSARLRHCIKEYEMNECFKGIFTALLTPFDEHGEVMDHPLEQLVDFNLKKGVKGFYVNGSTGETFMMDGKQKRHVLQVAKAAAGTRATMIAHVGCISTAQTVELARYAEKLGYDAVSAVAPFYYKFSLPEIKRHYETVAAAVDIPMLIYNFPAFSGVALTPQDITEMLQSDRFLGVKHTSNDFFALERVKAENPDKVIYNGYDEMFLAGLSMGADGGIGSTYNFMAEKFVRLYDAYHKGDLTGAQSEQREINRIIAALCKVGVMEAEKVTLSLMGIDMGHAMPPFTGATREQREYLQKEIVDRL